MWLRLIGGVFLCYLGVRTFLAKPAEQAASAEGAGLGSIYASTFFLTLTNPMTILAFAAIFAGLGLSSAGGDYLSAILLVIGVFLGSASVVAASQRWHRPVPEQVPDFGIDLGQQDFGRHHRRIRIAGSLRIETCVKQRRI